MPFSTGLFRVLSSFKSFVVRLWCRPDGAGPQVFTTGGNPGCVDGAAFDALARPRPAVPAVNPLSGLSSRTMLETRIATGTKRSRHSGTVLVVLWIDLHGAERAEQVLGREVGDEVLRAVAKRLRSHFNMENMLARVAPHAFAAVCEGIVDSDEIASRNAALRTVLADPVELDEGMIHVGSSIGAAVFPADADDPRGLLAAAASRAAPAPPPRTGQAALGASLSTRS